MRTKRITRPRRVPDYRDQLLPKTPLALPGILSFALLGGGSWPPTLLKSYDGYAVYRYENTKYGSKLRVIFSKRLCKTGSRHLRKKNNLILSPKILKRTLLGTMAALEFHVGNSRKTETYFFKKVICSLLIF